MTANTLRLWHSYISAFIAPTILFFAISGAFQVLRLHEAHDAYEPPAILKAMGSVHKDQVLSSPDHHHDGPGDMGGRGAPPPGAAHDDPPAKLSTQLLKGLFVIEAIGLVATIVLGVWVGITHPKRARTFWLLLGAGTLLPIALLVI